MARIKRGSRSYHTPSVAKQRAAKDYKPGEDVRSVKGEAAKQAQIEKETKAHNERKAKEKRQRLRKGYRATRVAAQGGPGAATDKKIHMTIKRGAEKGKRQSKPLGANQPKSDASNTPGEKQRPRVGSDARTRVGGGSPGSRVAGGLARARGR